LNDNRLPLENVRVVDFGQQIAGPAVAMTLADLGATVVHVDPPDGPQWDHPANAVLNRNKSCLRLNLKTEEGLGEALALIEYADVVIESFRPGVMKRLGIDYEQLRIQRPELITLSVPGFASNDELRREWKATESVVAASSGAFTDMGFNRVLMGVNPSFSPLPLGSSYAVSLAACSVVLALLEREKTGRGDHVEVPIAAALMEGLSYNSYVIEGLPERYKTMREDEIASRKASNTPMDLSYDQLQEFLDPFFRTYLCADGRMFYCVCPSHRNHAKRALQVLGIYDELVQAGLPEVTDLYQPISQWDGETSIGVYPLPPKWAKIISSKMKTAFLSKTSSEWGVIFGEGQIPGAPHRTTHEWVNSEHSNATGLIVEVNDPEFGLMKQPGPIAWFEGAPDAILKPRPRQKVSYQQALSILQEAAAGEDITRPSGLNTQTLPARGWLDGLRVLDLTNVIAGPHSCAFLARFGAEVTKLDPVTPLYDPLIGTLYSFQTDMGKRKALVDITSEEGRSVFQKMVRSVDLVVINAPERQLKSLGLDHESLQTINPGVLFCRLDCLGGPRTGPKTQYIGYDDIIQANSGIMSRFGGPNTPEEHAHVGTLDVNCGFAAGLSIALALYHKLRTGEITRARTSLAAMANIAQIPFAFDYPGRPPFDEPSGREVMGSHALSQFYQTREGWVFLDSSADELSKLEGIDALRGITNASNIGDFLRAKFLQAPAAQWIDLLHQGDIAAAQSQSIEDLRARYSRDADGTAGINRGSYAFSIHHDHPSGHRLTQIDHYSIRPSEARIKAVTAAERFGHSTRSILAELGYSESEVDSMIERGVAGEGWGNQYLAN